MITIYVPSDSTAVSVGADEVASAIYAAAQKAKTEIKLVRNGSRGLYWLEPMVEVATAEGLPYSEVAPAGTNNDAIK